MYVLYVCLSVYAFTWAALFLYSLTHSFVWSQILWIGLDAAPYSL